MCDSEVPAKKLQPYAQKLCARLLSIEKAAVSSYFDRRGRVSKIQTKNLVCIILDASIDFEIVSDNIFFPNSYQYGTMRKEYLANGTSLLRFNFDEEITGAMNELNVHVVDYLKDEYIILYACHVTDKSVSRFHSYESVKKYAWILVRDADDDGTVAWKARQRLLQLTPVRATSLYPTNRWQCHNGKD